MPGPRVFRVPVDEAREHGGAVAGVGTMPGHGVALPCGNAPRVVEGH